MTPQELDERIDKDTFAFINTPGLDDQRAIFKQLIRDCIEAVTPTVEQVDDGPSSYTPDFYLGINQTIDTTQANTKELLG